MANIAIILASGAGSRFRSEIAKQFMKLAGKSVMEHTINAFEAHPAIDEIIVVCAPDNRLLVEEMINGSGFRKVTKIVNGGTTRQASSSSGVAAITGDEHKVLVHDAVRPLLDHATIDRCLNALDEYDAVDTGIPSGDTIIKVDSDEKIVDIPERATLRLGQTPQGFRARLLREAHRRAATDATVKVTDDCGLILRYGLAPIKVVPGDTSNIKITYPSDIYLADRLFQLRSRMPALSDAGKALGGKVVVVFGGGRGIGERLAELAKARGATVRALSRRDGVDVADATEVRAALHDTLSNHGHVDMIVNTAGILHLGLLAGQDYALIDEQISTNLRGSVIVAREAFDVMKGTGGSIALFASSSYTRGRARSAVYSATKAAVVNLTQGLAQEFMPAGVRINAINPERTATPMRRENFGIEPQSELLDADAVASATLAVMLSDATGEVIDVRR